MLKKERESDILKYRLRIGENFLSSLVFFSVCDSYTQHAAQKHPCLLNGIALMETYISRIISVFSCKWFGGCLNTLSLSMNNSIIWIKWTPGAMGRSPRRAVDPASLPTSLFPSLSLSVLQSIWFHSPFGKCHTLVTLFSLCKNLCCP